MQSTGRPGVKQQRQGNAATELYDVEDPGPNDVLFGRGTGSNMHSGNIRFRALIQKYKPVYRDTPKKMKPSVSTKVVAIWRNQNPPGRFLTRSDRFHGSRRTFYDVGDAMARRKAAQCLREKSSKERLLTHQQSGEMPSLDDSHSERLEDPDATSNHEEDEDAPMPVLGGSLSAAINTDQCVTTSMEQAVEELISLPQDSNLEENKDMSVLDVVTSANLDQQFGPSLTKSEEPAAPQGEKALGLPSSKLLVPSTLKSLGCGSPKNDSMSLVGTFESNVGDVAGIDKDRNGSSDSPFLFASFDFENSEGEKNSNDERGLCFPSLFGGSEDNGNASTSLFGDDNSSSGFFGGGGSLSPFPFEEQPKDATPLPPPVLPPSLPNNGTKEEALQTIRDRMPTAASLTTNLFDW